MFLSRGEFWAGILVGALAYYLYQRYKTQQAN